MHEGVAILTLHGEHDLETAGDVRDAVDQALAEPRPCIFDLRPTAFIDSTIMAVLLETQQRCVELGVGFATALSEDEVSAVRRVIELTSIGPALSATTDFDAAIAAARRSA